MTNGVITVESVTGRLIVAEVRRNPGRTRKEIAAACGWSESHVGKALTAMHKAGLIGYVRDKRMPRWWLIELVPAAQAAVRAAAKEADREHNRAALRAWRVKKGGGSAWQKRELPDWPVHKVGATGPLPWCVNAVPSVFHLGGA